MVPDLYKIKVLILRSDRCPFHQWLNGLDIVTRAKISRRIGRIRLGNLGDWKRLTDGVFELRFNFGSGYRVYFAYLDRHSIILLGGSDKTDQKKAIAQAQKHWKEFKDENTGFSEELD